MDGSTNTLSGLNFWTLIITVAVLSAPIAIMLWKQRAAAPATSSEPVHHAKPTNLPTDNYLG
jgi:hypothetical protein